MHPRLTSLTTGILLQAKDYLEKLKYYKELGFSEKKIHAAYEKANKDWDKTIDILVGDT